MYAHAYKYTQQHFYAPHGRAAWDFLVFDQLAHPLSVLPQQAN